MEKELKQLKRMLELAMIALKESCEDKWFEYCPLELLDYFGLDEYGDPINETHNYNNI